MLYRTVKYLETGEIANEPAPREKIDVCLLHLRRLMEIKPEKVAVHEMRKHAAYYMKGIKGGAKVKARLNEMNTYAEMEALLSEYVDFVE
ncbi:tRNA-dihydrouridine synthase, partial [Streptococcus danieliae]|nr:tRNA-dihydrouridine synthase [Streptococcus danieliae]